MARSWMTHSAAMMMAGLAWCGSTTAFGQSTQPAADLTVTIANAPKAISPDLFGIFFEDINYAADGGLYAELIQNRSFEYQPTEQRTWSAASFWSLVTRGGGKGNWFIDAAWPVHPNNPHCVVLEVSNAGDGVGLMNDGFDGIPVKAGAQYDVSLFARQLYLNDRWGRGSAITGPMPIVVRLERENGQVLGETALQVDGTDWKRLAGSIEATATDDDARFVVLARARGGIAMDEISLFPRHTFKDRPNGLRADLAQTIADLHPKFIRFPGGCLAHGSGINNIYRWKDTIGPIEQRRGQSNLWGYHQSVGLGYYEYFQFCEDIGAKPLPVLAAGVSCQNSAHMPGIGQQCIPMADMPAYIQDVLDLIEWANGPATSAWGAKRAAAGHPAPFGLQYIGIGNEDHITPGFKERFKMIADAIKAKYPQITVVGTVGPDPSGDDFDAGWKFADAEKVSIVDEHYYRAPSWFWENLTRYADYDRTKPAVYVGEYAAHDRGRRNTLRSALAEAALLTSLERNGDVVRLSSYAPLLAKQGHTQWRPDMIYFDNTTVTPSINYDVQQLFSRNAGDAYLPTALSGVPGGARVAASCVRDSTSGDVIVKIVNDTDTALAGQVDMSAVTTGARSVTRTVLSGDPDAENAFGKPPAIEPRTTTLPGGATIRDTWPAHSLTVLRIPASDH